MKSPVVLITGAGGGIGAATASLYHHSGWHVIGVDIRSKDNNEISPGRYECRDISIPEEIEALFETIPHKEGRLDALVNNAGLQITKSLIDTEPHEWDAVMAVNVRAAYLCIKNAYPLLKTSRGSIVNISSVHALATSPSMAAYAASKGALLSLTKAAALELAKDHIRVNAILPGAVETSMLYAGLARDQVAGDGALHERLKRLSSRHPLERIGRPDEIAKIVFMLTNKAISSFITGQSIVVDGGVLSRLSSES